MASLPRSAKTPGFIFGKRKYINPTLNTSSIEDVR